MSAPPRKRPPLLLPEPSAPDLAAAAGRAWTHLLAEAERGFPDACHRMRFPAEAGFAAASPEQASDSFARGIVTEILLDCGALDTARREPVMALAAREARHLLDASQRREDGGLSYFPGLAELPPDADSLASAVLLSARAAPTLERYWTPWVALATAPLFNGQPLETWLIDPAAPASARAAMERGVTRFWGRGYDPAVEARFLRALLILDRARYHSLVAAALPRLLAQRAADGCWRATWYWSPVHATGLMVDLLYEFDPAHSALPEAAAALWSAQGDDGGWGPGPALPLDTAHALWCLGRIDGGHRRRRRGLACLLDLQRRDGAWNESAWIKMDPGQRPDGCCPPSFACASVTTAYALRALLQGARLAA